MERIDTKTCNICGCEKDLSEFNKHPKTKDKHSNKCKSCCSKYRIEHKKQCNKNRRDWIDKHPKFKKDRYLKDIKRWYNLTEEQYNKMFEEQHGCCAICGRSQKLFKNRLSVDHNHTTGKVRGLLCPKCNKMVGVIENNILVIEFAKEYLGKD